MTSRSVFAAIGLLLLAALIADQVSPPGEKGAQIRPTEQGKHNVFASIGVDDTPAKHAIRIALDKPITLDLVNVPLRDALPLVEEQLDVDIVIDELAFRDEGIPTDEPVTLNVKQLPSRDALTLILDPLQLDWIIESGVIKITTMIVSEDFFTTRLYDVADLVTSNDHTTGSPFDFNSLTELLLNSVSPFSWEIVGGPGTIGEFETEGIAVLVIRQTRSVHEEIDWLLNNLRKMRHDHRISAQPAGLQQLLKTDRMRQAVDTKKIPRFISDDPDRQAVVEGGNQFGFALARQIDADPHDNLIVSPLSVSQVLALVAAGADGKTAEELQTVLHLPQPEARAHAGYERLLAAFPGRGRGGLKLNLRNRIFWNRELEFHPAFMPIAQGVFRADSQIFPTIGPESIRDSINNWLSQVTSGQIPQAIPVGAIPDLPGVVIANAVDFEAGWQNPFQVRDTKLEIFHAPSGDVKVPMMRQTAWLKYADIDGTQILECPYADESLSMFFMLPKPHEKESETDPFLKTWNADTFTAWRNQLNQQNVDVYLPRFRFDSFYDLRPPLEVLGVKQLFDQDSVDLSRMVIAPHIQTVFLLHQAAIEVNEQGTRAAAGTPWGSFGGGLTEVPQFRADRPFYILIHDARTGAILFLGRVCNPQKLSGGG